MPEIRAINKNRGVPSDGLVVLVDRSNPLLGNHKFPISKPETPGERLAAINGHRDLVEKDRKLKGPISKAMDAFADAFSSGMSVYFVCHCYPLPCHADTYVNEVLDRIGST